MPKGRFFSYLHVSLMKLIIKFDSKVQKEMSKIEYKTIGSYIREQRVQLKMPLRKLAAELDIDTSTLSKIEKGERQANLEMIPVLAKVFKIDFKNLQIRFLSDKLVNDYEKEEFVVEALKEAINKIDNIVNAANL